MDDQHADPMFDAERVARSGIDRLAEYLDEPASLDAEGDDQAIQAEVKREKARLGHKALTAYSSLRSTRQREITGAFMIGKDIGAPRSAMVPLFEALTGKPVAHLLPPDRERPDGEGDKAPASA